MNTEDKKLEYNQYLLSKEWNLKRKKAFLLFGRICQKCSNTSLLHVHHKTYARFMDEDVENDLAILCEKCHHRYHTLYKYTSVETTNEFITSNDYCYKFIPKRNLSREQRIERYTEKQRIKKENKKKSKKVKDKFKIIASKERAKKVDALKKLLANHKIDKQEYFSELRKL